MTETIVGILLGCCITALIRLFATRLYLKREAKRKLYCARCKNKLAIDCPTICDVNGDSICETCYRLGKEEDDEQ